VGCDEAHVESSPRSSGGNKGDRPRPPNRRRLLCQSSKQAALVWRACGTVRASKLFALPPPLTAYTLGRPRARVSCTTRRPPWAL